MQAKLSGAKVGTGLSEGLVCVPHDLLLLPHVPQPQYFPGILFPRSCTQPVTRDPQKSSDELGLLSGHPEQLTMTQEVKCGGTLTSGMVWRKGFKA